MPVDPVLFRWLLLPSLCALLCTLWIWQRSGHWAPQPALAARRRCLLGLVGVVVSSLLTNVVDSLQMQAWLLTFIVLLTPWPFLRELARGMEAQKQLELAQWRRDGLTGVLTRKAFMEQALTLPRSDGGGLILLDIDHFKRVNDQHLHTGGDRVLAHVARRLAALVRITDILGRHGGEEFCMLLPGQRDAAALELAERLVADARGQRVRMPYGGEQGYTLSAGVASCSRWPDTVAGWEELMHRADAALYAAKRAGRDRACEAAQLVGQSQRGEPDLRCPALTGLREATEPS